MLEYAKKGLHTSLGFCWGPYFDTNLKKEVSYALGRKLPMVFCDTDRAKQTYGETTPEALFLTPDEPYIGDPGLRDYAADRIEAGDDIVTAIFDNIDGQGHAARFGISGEYKGAVINCDLYANSILNLIEEREKTTTRNGLLFLPATTAARASATDHRLQRSARHGLRQTFPLTKNIIRQAMTASF